MRGTPEQITEAEALRPFSWIQEYDGFHCYKDREGGWVLASPGTTESRTSDQLDYPIRIRYARKYDDD